MFFDTTKLGQLTLKDCWISATMVAIFLAMDYIDDVIVFDRYVTLPNSRTIELYGDVCGISYSEKVSRAVRVYMAGELRQQRMSRDALEYLGTPDSITELLFRRRFKTYSLEQRGISRLVYHKADIEAAVDLLSSKKTEDIFLVTFRENRFHLYAVIGLKPEDSSIVVVVDVSNLDLVVRERFVKDIVFIKYLI